MTDWQQKLDDTFPFGGAMTQIEDVPEGVGHDDSPQFLTPRLVVAEDGENPTITVGVADFDKELSFTLTGMEETSPGTWLLSTPEGEPDFLLSTNLDPEIRNSLRNTRREWYGDE